jgi:hypothetical protein
VIFLVVGQSCNLVFDAQLLLLRNVTWFSSIPEIWKMFCNLCFDDIQPLPTHRKQIVIENKLMLTAC